MHGGALLRGLLRNFALSPCVDVGYGKGSQKLFKKSGEVWNRNQRSIPQGLKPLAISAFFGTTEVVPFQDGVATKVFTQVPGKV